MKKAILFLLSSFMFCSMSSGLVLINQNAFAMSATTGNDLGNTTTAKQVETERKIVITEKVGYLYEKKSNGEFVLQKKAEEVAYKVGALSIEELKKKLNSSDYLERVWAYFYYRVYTNHKIDVELCHENEEGWDQVIAKLIVDLHLSLEESGNADIQKQAIMIILEGFNNRFIEYIRKTEIDNYSDPGIRRMLIFNLEKIAIKNPTLNSEVIFIIDKLKNDNDINVKRAANKAIERLSLK